MDQFTKTILSRKEINLDTTHRCSLECPRCQRYTSFTRQGLKVPGEDLSIKNFQKVLNHFDHINFCGQVSDPVHHPKFITFLKMIKEQGNKTCSVHHASAAKPYDWYIEAFKANPNAKWWFGIDGLPEQSCLYRINQDGEKLYKIMIEARKILNQKPIWQYIVFSYNEESIDEAQRMAKDIDVRFMIHHSSRWLGKKDPYRPKNPEYSLSLRNN